MLVVQFLEFSPRDEILKYNDGFPSVLKSMGLNSWEADPVHVSGNS